MNRKRDFKRYSSLILLGLVVLLCVTLKAATVYPKPTSYKYLNDYAGVVDQKSAQQIISLGRELEQRTGAQAVVVTLKSLKGVPIEDYANGLFRRWGIGQTNKDNGLLILLAVDDKQWRVEVGRGLEGAVPDALSNRIMIELGRPEFATGNYGVGLARSYSQLTDQIAAEYGVALTHSLHTSFSMDYSVPNRNNANYTGYWVILAIIFIDIIFNRGRILRLLLLSSFFGGNHRRGGGGGYGGGYGGFGGGSSNGGGSSGGW